MPIDNDGYVYLVCQYRLGIEGYTLEIPAGIKEINENTYQTACREIEEEIGFIAEIEFLTTFMPAVGYSDEKIDIYLAKNLKKSQTNYDAEEFIQIKKIKLEESYKLIENGNIIDSKTIIALLYYKMKYGD